jgi:hypothetical protein
MSENPAVANLRACQRQLDMDGCEVGVSRQAVDETLALYDALLDRLKYAIAVLEEAECRLGYSPGSLGALEMDDIITTGHAAIATAEGPPHDQPAQD